MAKPEWGTKRTCQSCGARFYDFGKAEPVCPACGAVFDLEILNRARRSRPATRAAAVADEPEEAVLDDTEAGTGDEDLDDTEAEDDEGGIEAEEGQEEDDALIEDASELGEDDDMSDVIDSEIDEEEAR